jgi:hypothetical protein
VNVFGFRVMKGLAEQPHPRNGDFFVQVNLTGKHYAATEDSAARTER